MFVRTYVSKYIESNCYMVYNDKYAFIVDPSVPYEVIKKDLKTELIAIIITHGHFDHFMELNSYLENNPNIKIYLHEEAIKKLENASLNYSKEFLRPLEIKCDERFIKVKEGKYKIEEDLEIAFIETFGHSNCSLTILVDNLLFTGDFLFKGGIGRIDLYSGNNVMMRLSLKKIKNYPLNKYDDYYIYPGHGDFSTLNYEKKYNFYLK